MAVNDITLVNGVTKQETATGFVYDFPTAQIVTQTANDQLTISTRVLPVIVNNVSFESITEQYSAANVEEYVDYLANNNFFFEAGAGNPDLQIVTDKGNVTTNSIGLWDSSIVLADELGNVKGTLTETSEGGIVLAGLDEEINESDVSVIGDQLNLGKNSITMAFNGASSSSYVTLLAPITVGGVEYFPLQSVPLPPPTVEETLSDSTDYDISSGVQTTILSDSFANPYVSNSQYEIRFWASESASKSTRISIIVEINGVPSASVERSIPADSSTEIVISGNTSSAITAAQTIELKVTALDTGAGRNTDILGATTGATTIHLSTSSALAASSLVKGINTENTDTELDEEKYYRITSGSNYTIVSAATNYNENNPFSMIIKNVSGSDVNFAADGSDTFYGLGGTVTNFDLADGEVVTLTCSGVGNYDIL